KDWVRLPEDDGTALSELRFRSRPLLIAIEFGEGNRGKRLLVGAIDRKRMGKPKGAKRLPLSPAGRGRVEALGFDAGEGVAESALLRLLPPPHPPPPTGGGG